MEKCSAAYYPAYDDEHGEFKVLVYHSREATAATVAVWIKTLKPGERITIERCTDFGQTDEVVVPGI